jgi:hypothetical protein
MVEQHAVRKNSALLEWEEANDSHAFGAKPCRAACRWALNAEDEA